MVLPRALVDLLEPDQAALIVAHERAHARRGDPALFVALAWIDVLFWMNPFVRTQTRRVRLAAEVACDAAVTVAAPAMRRAYADAFVAAWKHSAGNAVECAPAVFSNRNSGRNPGEHRMRIAEIMRAPPARSKTPRAAAVALAAALVLPVAGVQMAVAAANARGAPAFDVMPVDGRLTSAFGELRPNLPNANDPHRGVDIGALEGTAIHAPAPGRVTLVAEYESGYGKIIEIDHGGGYATRYAHLSAFDVAVGDDVAAGQVIGRVGSSGLSTAPHLHLEVYQDGALVDPASVMPLPDAVAK